MDVCVKFADYVSNSGRIIRHFCAVFNCILQSQEAASDVIVSRFVMQIAPNKIFVMLTKTFLEKFHPKPSEAAFSTVFRYNIRPEVVSDAKSGVAVEHLGMGITIEFGYSSRSVDIRAAQFVIENE